MNTLLNKIKLSKGFLSLVLLLSICAMPQTVFAQSSSEQPEDVSVKPYNPPPGYPFRSWPYTLPAGNTANSPVYEYNAFMYLPYLPWIGANIAQLVNYANFFYQLQQNNYVIGGAYNAPITTLANIARSDIADTLLASINEFTQKNVSFLFKSDHSEVLTQLVSLPGTDTYLPCQSGIGCYFSGSSNTPPDDSNFNANFLFNRTGYSGDDTKKLNHVISFLSGLAQPFEVSNMLSSDPEERRKQLQDTTVQKYLLSVRSYIASQSMVLSNFAFLAKEREIVSDLGKKAGMTTLPTDGNEKAINDASPLQVDEFLVKRRTGNPSWYTAVNNASSSALQRETLYVLAEINAQLYQLRMVNERMLASLSLIQMQSAQMNKSFLSYQQQSVRPSSSSSDSSNSSSSDIDKKGQEGVDKALNG